MNRGSNCQPLKERHKEEPVVFIVTTNKHCNLHISHYGSQCFPVESRIAFHPKFCTKHSSARTKMQAVQIPELAVVGMVFHSCWSAFCTNVIGAVEYCEDGVLKTVTVMVQSHRTPGDR